MSHVVYLYSDPLTLTPRYVGKAHNKHRMLRHVKGQSHNPKLRQMIDVARKRGVEVQPEVICSEIKDNLSASAIERFWIATIGRGDQKRGPLFNGTDGGDGVVGRTGFKRTPRTPEECKKLGEAVSNSPRFRAVVASPEWRKKVGEAGRGKNKGRKHKLTTCPHCGKEGGITIMKRWHFDNCKEKPNG